MKKLLIILLAIVSINSCCKKDTNCEPNCALPDGTYCPKNMINVNNNCECEEGFFEYKDECLDIKQLKGGFIVPLDCNCFDDISFSVDQSGFGLRLTFKDDTYYETHQGFDGTKDNFSALIINPQVDCNPDDGKNTYPEFVGTVIDGELTLNVYYREQGPGWDTPVDSCGPYIAQMF